MALMPDRLSRRATWLLSRAHLRSHRLLQDLFAAAESRPHHYRILAALDSLGDTDQAGICRVTGIDRSDMSAALDVLCQGGFVVRGTQAADRRRKIITLTDRGRNELVRLDSILDIAQERFLAPLSPVEQATFFELITKLGSQADRQ